MTRRILHWLARILACRYGCHDTRDGPRCRHCGEQDYPPEALD
jgi:hypothetical protein